MFSILSIIVFITALIDVLKRQIPNALCLVVFIVSAHHSLSAGSLAYGLYSTLIVLVTGMLLFKLNLFAAGDGKLAAAFAAALLPSQLLPAVIYTLVIGGGLALFYLVKDRLICQYLLKQSREKEKGLPYGVAIAIGFYLQILVAYY